MKEAELSMERRLGGLEGQILAVQANLANTYQALERHEEAALMHREVYSGRLKLNGEEHRQTLQSANNYAMALNDLKRFKEARSLLRKTIPVARRALGSSDVTTLSMRHNYAEALYHDPGATLDDIHEAVTTLEDTARTSRRVLGGTHPLVAEIEQSLRHSRAALDARETASA